MFKSKNSCTNDVDVSENCGTPKSSILIGFSIINHPFWGTPIFGNTHVFNFLNEKASERLLFATYGPLPGVEFIQINGIFNTL